MRWVKGELEEKGEKGEKGGNIKDDKGEKVGRVREGIRWMRTTRISKSNIKERCIEGK